MFSVFRVVWLAVVLLVLQACSDKPPPPPKPKQPNSHGVVLLFDEDFRRFSNINTCAFLDEAKKWVSGEYPESTVAGQGWSSSAFFYMDVEMPEYVTRIYFNGSIIDMPMECD